MNSVLADTSVWIDYFKGEGSALPLNSLLDGNLVCTNDVILSELLPAVIHKREFRLRDLLYSVTKLTLKIDWDQIRDMQTRNIKKGINKIGVADLIIAQNALQNKVPVYTSDKHFLLMGKAQGLELFGY